jgi:uncharacterized protein
LEKVWFIINKYFPEGSKARPYYVSHVESVTKKALELCRQHRDLNLDCALVEQAAMLHDIGIWSVNAPYIGCFGDAPYIQHGILGAKIVRNEELAEIAPFCENHIGTGITIADIRLQHLPLPERNMEPQTTEQKLVAYADKFFSKTQKNTTEPKSIEEIYKSLRRYGEEKITIFEQWRLLFD